MDGERQETHRNSRSKRCCWPNRCLQGQPGDFVVFPRPSSSVDRVRPVSRWPSKKAEMQPAISEYWSLYNIGRRNLRTASEMFVPLESTAGRIRDGGTCF